MFIIAGLGNPTREYEGTRHNVGFDVIDRLAARYNIDVDVKKHRALIGKGMIAGQKVILAKPQTYMNLSGNAVRYWLQKENIPIENLLVVVDDLALPFGSLRLKPRGSDAGHNGLKHIQQILGTDAYARLRFGIGNDFPRGGQIDFVLGTFPTEEEKLLPERLERAGEIIKEFCLAGIQNAMNHFNNK